MLLILLRIFQNATHVCMENFFQASLGILARKSLGYRYRIPQGGPMAVPLDAT